MKSVSLNLLEPSGPVQAYKGIALPFLPRSILDICILFSLHNMTNKWTYVKCVYHVTHYQHVSMTVAVIIIVICKITRSPNKPL